MSEATLAGLAPMRLKRLPRMLFGLLFSARSLVCLFCFSRARLHFTACSGALPLLACQCCFVRYAPCAVSLVAPLELPGIFQPTRHCSIVVSSCLGFPCGACFARWRLAAEGIGKFSFANGLAAQHLRFAFRSPWAPSRKFASCRKRQLRGSRPCV